MQSKKDRGGSMRVILYTGKGGVGKTSMAAMSACHIAKQGKKTLIMSTDFQILFRLNQEKSQRKSVKIQMAQKSTPSMKVKKHGKI